MLLVVVGLITFGILLLLIYDISYFSRWINFSDTMVLSVNATQASAPEIHVHNEVAPEVKSKRNRLKELHKKTARFCKRCSSSTILEAKKRLKRQISTPATAAGFVYKKL